MRSEIKDLVSYYQSESLNFIPIKRGDKKPLVKWQEYQSRKITNEEIEKYFYNADNNIGVLCVGNFFGIDVDDEEIFHKLFPKTEGLVIVKTNRGYHVYFKADHPVKTLKINDDKGREVVTLKGEGSYLVAPPSKHPSGHVYEFLQKGKIPKLNGDPRQELIEKAEKIGLKVTKEPINIQNLLEGVEEGNRDNSLTHLIHFLKKGGESKEKILKLCHAWNKRNKPPLSDSDIKEKIDYHFEREQYNYYFDIAPGKYNITDNLELIEKSTMKKSKIEQDRRVKHKAYFEKEGKLYIEVLTTDGKYQFASLNEKGNVELTDSVGDIYPVELPRTTEGEMALIVKMPNEKIQGAKLLPPFELLEEIKKHIVKYCDLFELDIELCSYYALFSWFYRKCNTVGYLRFLADTGKGKSRMLTVVSDLSFYPTSAAGSGSFSGMMRIKEHWHGTIVIDEADMIGDKESQIVKYLNLGFESGKYFLLSDKQDPKKQDVFDPFCPKIIAMREPFRDNATEGRLLSLSPHETSKKSIPIILNETYFKETAQLRNEIARFVLQHWNAVDGKNMLSFDDLQIEPRLQQLAMPLSIIFQLWNGGEKKFKEYLVKRQSELKRERAHSWHGSIFNLVYDIAKGEEHLENFDSFYNSSGEIQAITPSMIAKIMSTSPRTVTAALTSIGFEVELKYIKQHKTGEEGEKKSKKQRVRAYTVPDEKTWCEIIQRYYYADSEDGTDRTDGTLPDTRTDGGGSGTDRTDILTLNGYLIIPDVLKSRKYISSKDRVLLSVPSVLSVPYTEGEVASCQV